MTQRRGTLKAGGRLGWRKIWSSQKIIQKGFIILSFACFEVKITPTPTLEDPNGWKKRNPSFAVTQTKHKLIRFEALWRKYLLIRCRRATISLRIRVILLGITSKQTLSCTEQQLLQKVIQSNTRKKIREKKSFRLAMEFRTA